jgi:rhodanese-related sulfurtransferase
MTTTQIVLYVFILLAAALYLRRWWLQRGLIRYSPLEVAERLKQHGAYILLDVRTTGERSRNSIKGSLHIPLHELGKRIEELRKHENKEIICYCQSGNRSMLAASRLKKAGFTVANMNGGIAEWNSSGLR